MIPPLWQRIDTRNHGVIEASAGTGKTYTIEHLVGRLLRENEDLSLEQILVVTFTEKATGELKERVRAHLEEDLAGSDLSAGERTRLQDAVDNFDRARISTIHGFCHRVLGEYAFENGRLFDAEPAADESFAVRLFREELRAEPTRNLLRRLPPDARLRLARKGYEEDTVVSLALAMRDDDRLLPEPSDEDADRAALAAAFARIAAALPAEAAAEPGRFILDAYAGFSLGKAGNRKGFQHRSADPVMAVPAAALDRFARDGGTLTPDSLQRLDADYCAISYGRFTGVDDDGRTGFRALVPPAMEGDDGTVLPPPEASWFRAVIETLADRVAPILERRKPLAGTPEAAFLIHCIRALRVRIEAWKETEGVLTFDDMVNGVRKALCPMSNRAAEILRDALRQRFRFALVDEFQDTDPAQWDIFHTLFPGADPNGRHLFLVGDPKQAIYSFRGADVYTYREAVHSVRTDCGTDALYSLDTNFRSLPELLDVFNRMFASPTWFPPADDGPADAGAPALYRAVEAPPETSRKARVFHDATGRAPLTVVHLREADDPPDKRLTIPRAARRLARFIAGEIERLLARPGDFVAADEGRARPLRPGDICILVRTRSRAAGIEAELRARGIPFTFYKKPGVYASEEALHLSALLGTLADPSDGAFRKALLTRFFGYSPAQISAGAAADPQVHAALERWRDLAERRRWPEFFRAVLLDTGTLVREAAEPDADRRLTNFEQLSRDLIAVAATGTGDARDLRDFLLRRRQRAEAPDADADLHQPETEESKVVLMTMHASKGLQFPLVFIGDAFSDARASSRDACLTYHRDGIRVFELKTGAPQGKDAARAEMLEELKRLYYVALTRARYKLYLPYDDAGSGRSATPLPARALGGLLRPGEYRNDDRVGHSDTDGNTLGEGMPSPPVCPLPPEGPGADGTPDTATTELQPLFAVLPDVRRGLRHLDSYTALAAGSAGSAHGGGPGPAPFRADDEDWEHADPPPEPLILPAGATAGSVLHEVLETVDFATVRAYEKLTGADMLAAEETVGVAIDRAMRRYRLADRKRPDAVPPAARSTREEIAELVRRALNTPINSEGLRVGDIAPENRRAELEFHLDEGGRVLGGAASGSADRGLINGYIDLVFRHAGRYFILDWKSNLLSAYDPAALSYSMAAHEYTLQYRIYTVAAATWLATCIPRFSIERDFGGIYYVFLRGLGTGEPGAGVFFDSPDTLTVEAYKREIRKRLDVRHGRRGEERA